MWNDILSLFQLKFPLVQGRNNKHVARENKKIQIPSFTENLLTDIVFTAWSQLDPCNKSISNFIRHASFDTWNRNFWETIYCPLLLNFGSLRKKLVSNKIAKTSRRVVCLLLKREIIFIQRKCRLVQVRRWGKVKINNCLCQSVLSLDVEWMTMTSSPIVYIPPLMNIITTLSGGGHWSQGKQIHIHRFNWGWGEVNVTN